MSSVQALSRTGVTQRQQVSVLGSRIIKENKSRDYDVRLRACGMNTWLKCTEAGSILCGEKSPQPRAACHVTVDCLHDVTRFNVLITEAIVESAFKLPKANHRDV